MGSRPWRRRWAGAASAIVLALLAGAAPAGATPFIHAHRGGSVIDNVPRYPENTMPAFRNAARNGWVLELDVKLTSDDVPVVIHDHTPDRTTTCDEGKRVRDYTAAELLDGCKVDVLGSPGSGLPTQPITNPANRVRLSRLSTVLAFAKQAGARVNMEIKNIPTENDFDSGSGYANEVVDRVVSTGFPPSRLIVQSFWPANLDVAEARLPEAETSLLTLAELNEPSPPFADANGYEWVSPAWTVTPTYIADAHNLGLRIVPYTLNTPLDVKNAADAGVDEVISDDPAMARKALAQAEPPAPAVPPPPGAAECASARAKTTMPTIRAYDPAPGAPRVFAMQPKQEVKNVVSYQTFRNKIECMIRQRVLPNMARGRPNVVAFNEDIGLATIATGSRGQAAREIAADPGAPSCEGQPAPCGALAALEAVRTGYSKEVNAYRARFPSMSPVSDPFVAATDTFARGWMQVFSDMARRYGVYILGSNNQPLFRESRDPAEIAAFTDPDLCPSPGAAGCPSSVYIATGDRVYNEVFMWGPQNARQEGPWPLRNVVASNKKVPLTQLERDLQFTDGPATGPDAVENVRPYRIPGTDARVGFATSLPAFFYDGPPALPPGADPCSDTSKYYMRCLDKLGVNLVMQDEANSGRWASDGGGGYWQPLEWMTSTYRAVNDPSVNFAYNVTPFMVGNLVDVAFDGQTTITQRGLSGPGCNYVGNGQLMPDPPENDPQSAQQYVGSKPRFLALAPWRFPDGPRNQLRAQGGKLSPSSDDPQLENDYLETAVVADLPFPPNPTRPGCVSTPAPLARCTDAAYGDGGPNDIRGTGHSDRLVGRAGGDRLRGRRGADCLIGGRGPDRLEGGPGPDRLVGGAGGDSLHGGPGLDRLLGGAGPDTIDATDRRAEIVRCGAGRDRALLGRRDTARGCEVVSRP